MQKTDTGTLKKQTIGKMADVLKEGWYFIVLCHMFLCVGKVIQHFAKKLEGCFCHEAVWVDKRHSFKKRKRIVEQDTCADNCCWKGRRGPWWAAQGVRELFDAIRA